MITTQDVKMGLPLAIVALDNDLDDFIRYTATTGGGGGNSGRSGGRGGKGWYVVIAILCILSLVGKCSG